MPKAKIFFGLLVIIGIGASSTLAQEFTLTTTNANTVSSKSSIDMPGLTGNPHAIIVATPAGGTSNPHPIGAWYYSGKWNIFNTDHAVMPLGAKYKVQFFLQPGPNQFLHLITQQNTGSEGSYIDNPALNNNPNAQVQILQNHSPDVRPGSALNSFEARAAYSPAAGRWYIANVNGELLRRGGAYNVVVSSGSSASVAAPSETTPTNQPGQSVPKVTTPSKTGPAVQPLQPVTNVSLQATPAGPQPVSPAPVSATTTPAAPANAPPKLYGFVDMHTHPVSQLGFGEQLFFGDNDGDPNIALGSCNCVHNFLVPLYALSCGSQNLYRNQMVDSLDDANHIAPRHLKVAGFPNFDQWPKYNSILHQQMWIDWIKRAKEGGLRVMVALAVNNHTIADAAETGGVNDDLASMNKQLVRMKELFHRHPDFLEIAYTSADLRRIVASGKLAVILGIEMDNIGNFYNPADKKGAVYNPNPSDADIKNEIDRLFSLGVRYIFPIHITNNVFGGSALYSSDFSIANKYNTGSAFSPEEVDSAGGITFQLQHPFRPMRQSILGNMFMFATGPVLPPQIMPDQPANYPYPPPPLPNKGHRNSLGLTPKGETAIRYMMKKGDADRHRSHVGKIRRCRIEYGHFV